MFAGDGYHLLKKCHKAEKILKNEVVNNGIDDANYCLGLVKGVQVTMQIMTIHNQKIKVCFPKNGLTGEQSITGIVEYLENNPTKLHQKEVFLIFDALQEKYPCKNNN